MTVNVALVGLGHWGKNHLKGLLRLQSAGKIGTITLCDARIEHGKEMAKNNGVQFEPDFDKIIADPKIDAIDIATSTDSHYSLGKKALQAGKDVLIEKPLAYTVDECDDLIATADQKSKILMVGHVFRFHPAIEKLKELLSKDYFGKVRYIDIVRQAIRIPRQDMGVLHALTIHDVDLVCYLFNQPVPLSISTYAQSFFSEYPDENAIVIMKFQDAGIGKIESSWIDPVAQKARTLKLIGSRRSAFIDFLKPNEVIVFDEYVDSSKDQLDLVQGGKQIMEADEGMPLDRELAHFIECVATRAEPLTSGKVGRAAVELIEKALDSVS